jgi:enamine deaminase RidA (YjgF/YER057c/UK114 family)
MSLKRFHTGKRMSEMVVHGNVAYLAGQVAGDPSQDVAGQTTQVLAAIDALLAEAGTDKTKILRAEIFLADIAAFSQMNGVWDTWVPAGNTPARATVEAKLAAPQYKVEIVITAAI